MNAKAQHIDWIKHLIEIEDFTAKDFLLTAPRARPGARERRRRQIAQLLYRFGLSAHDLIPPSSAQAVATLCAPNRSIKDAKRR